MQEEQQEFIKKNMKENQEQVEQYFKEKYNTLQSIANINNLNNSAANESKNAITERIISTVTMMKDVLQTNLSLRETINVH